MENESTAMHFFINNMQCGLTSRHTKYNVHVHALNTSLIDYCGGGDIISWSCWGSIVTASSVYLSMDRRRAFMKKLATVETLSPNCSAMVACISLDGRLVSLKMAYRVRL